MQKTVYFLLFMAFGFLVPAQNIRGIVKDKQTQNPLIGATIQVLKSEPIIVTSSNENGEFLLAKAKLGRVQLQVQYVGYQPLVTEAFILGSIKDVFLELELSQDAAMLNDVVVKSSHHAFEPINALSVVSTRSFSVEETERMPAGANDPGRVALSYPGVQRGQDDSENQIIVRGNSPSGIMWRLEGIDIPNPNHFALIGSSGGGVTVFSAQLMSKSDFSTGGFAAEYGNAIAGFYDIKLRQGNRETRENRFRLGVLGIDAATEGPIQKGRSSYLVNYRYSTLGLLSKMGFYLVGERVTNDFQDLSFNLAFNSKNNKSIVTVFGVGGLSEEHYMPVEIAEKRKIGVANHWEDRVKPANVGAFGVTWTRLLDDKSYLKTVVALMGSRIARQYDTLNLKDVRFRYDTELYNDKRLAASITYSRKFNDKMLLKTGLIANQIFFDFLKNSKPRNNITDINQLQLKTNVQGEGSTQQLQQYTQLQYSPSSKINLNIGYHILKLFVNQDIAIEPRLSAEYKINENQRLSAAFGLHSKTLPLMSYYLRDSSGTLLNKDLKLLRSQHFVVAYHLFTRNNMRLSVETYAQKLSKIPVQPDAKSSYWMLNFSGDYPEFKVLSEGKGVNLGLDAALEKRFSNSYFFLLNGSAMKGVFETYDGKTYNTRFNTRFSSSYTAGKEFYWRKNRVLQIGGRFLYNGGFRYTPFDPVLSKAQGRYVEKSDALNEGQVPAYQRLDVRIAYRFNARRWAGNISLDIQNVLDKKNATNVAYDALRQTTVVEYRGSGLIPLLSLGFDF
jgi:CarboxypepD_reg-like domain